MMLRGAMGGSDLIWKLDPVPSVFQGVRLNPNPNPNPNPSAFLGVGLGKLSVHVHKAYQQRCPTSVRQSFTGMLKMGPSGASCLDEDDIRGSLAEATPKARTGWSLGLAEAAVAVMRSQLAGDEEWVEASNACQSYIAHSALLGSAVDYAEECSKAMQLAT